MFFLRKKHAVPTRTLPELNLEINTSRTFEYSEAFYSIYNAGKRIFALEARPKGLIPDAIPTQRDLKKYQVSEKRLACVFR